MFNNKNLTNFQRLSLYNKKKLLQERKLQQQQQQHLPLSTMPISKNSEKKEQAEAKKTEKLPQEVQVNQWVLNGSFGSKEAVLIFRTNALAANAASHGFDQENYLDTPSTSSTCDDISKALSEKNFVLPQNVLDDRRVDSETFNFTEKKVKKRTLESSFSLSSSSSSSNGSSDNQLELNIDGNSDGNAKDVENKENIVPQPLDKEEMPAALFSITFKFLNTETRLLRKILIAHGLKEVPHDANDFNILWTGNVLKPDIFRSLSMYQRVNHFPRSSELTRKDRLYKNIERMQHFRGLKHFDFVPQTFLIPADYKELVFAHNKCKGPWIVKPVASSRGRGIFLAKTPDEVQSHISSDEQVVVSRYISEPLCIDNHKCDIRIYVAVTSFNPLVIYLYEEGLVRIATVRYSTPTSENLWNPCMHLCNYSINKYHTDYIKSNNASLEDHGQKWALGALLRHLKNQGCNTEQLMLNIEDIIIKAILSCTQSIVSACRMFVNHHSNCFELFGFDILVDDTLKPWLIEVNLSPSLGCDSPLDTKIKANLLTDLLTLVGIPAISPFMKASMDNKGVKVRSLSSSRRVNSAEFVHNTGNKKQHLSTLSAEELKIVKSVKKQFERRGGFVRIFPTSDSMQKYEMFLDQITGIPSASSTNGNGSYLMIIPHNHNQMLFEQLFGKNCSDIVEDDIDERMHKYERTLDRTLPIVIGPKNTSKNQDGVKILKQQIRKLIENGEQLSPLQARRAFSHYLEHILRRLSMDGKHSHEEYILKFLQRIAIYMRQPFFIRNVTHNRIMIKERGAIIAKLLSDYLHLYNKDTEAFLDSFERKGFLPSKLFDDFLQQAQELDIENILTLHTNITQTMPFLYNSCSPSVPVAPPIPSGAHGFLKSLPCMCPGSHVKDFWRSDLARQEKTRVHGKKPERSGRLSPIKKKVTLHSTGKIRDDRSGWMHN